MLTLVMAAGPGAGPGTHRSASRPPMPRREFDALAGEVAAICQRYGVDAWDPADVDRLDAALWRFIHPDLACTAADPWNDPDED
jgi:hypothetical protein